MLLRPALGALSPAGSRARLSVLIFHRVAAGPDALYPGRLDAARFDQLLGWLAGWFNVLPLDSAIEALAKQQLPSRALSITFDDGYADNHDVAMPLLKRRGMSATFFIATGFLDGGRMWNDTVTEAIRSTPLDALDAEPLGVPGLGLLPLDSLPARRAAIETVLMAVKYLHPERRLQVVEELARRAQARLPDDLMMTSAQVRQLHAAGMQVGAHTCNHPILAVLPPDQARHEIAASRAALEQLLDKPVGLFAYPNGKPGTDFSPETVGIVRDLGFAAAVTTAPGAANAASDLMEIPRFTPWDRTRWRFGARLAKNLL